LKFAIKASNLYYKKDVKEFEKVQRAIKMIPELKAL
jgi:hypothetical protein